MNLIKQAHPQFGVSDTLMNLAREMAQDKLEENLLWSALNADEQAKELSRVTGEVLKEFQSNLSLGIDPEEKLSVAVHEFLTDTFMAWYEKGGQAFLIGTGALLFFIFRGLGAILYFPIAALSFLFYQLLIAMNVIHIAGESKLKEIVEYS
jgi:hypothetical protein